MNVKGVPLFYLPILYYPTKKEDRATGFLLPTYGQSTLQGQSLHNAFFWAKMASFAAIGLLSVPPTMAFIRWRKSGAAPDEAAIKSARRYLHTELALFVLLLIFAAAMARGYGEF